MSSETKSRFVWKKSSLHFIAFILFQLTSFAQQGWIEQTSGTIKPLTAVSFTDSDNGTAVGYEGTILRTTNGGVSFVEEKPTDYTLSQNYPNPFNPGTKIKYSIPQLSTVVIKVLDIIGNEIEILIADEKQAGTYELTWYVENLPCGIYFYQLQAGNFV